MHSAISGYFAQQLDMIIGEGFGVILWVGVCLMFWMCSFAHVVARTNSCKNVVLWEVA